MSATLHSVFKERYSRVGHSLLKVKCIVEYESIGCYTIELGNFLYSVGSALEIYRNVYLHNGLNTQL